MNALADARVADYLNENFICTYLKVGTFQIINEQKVGGNVASYFCLADSSVVHAVPGQVGADKLLAESRWAYETRKSANTLSTNLGTGEIDARRYHLQIRKAHLERYNAEANSSWQGSPLPATLPTGQSQQAQAHWLLARTPLAKLEMIYPVVWTRILNEKLSGNPVEKR